MDFQRRVDDMRTRTALVLFLTSIVIGGLLVFALGALAAAGAPGPGSPSLVSRGAIGTQVAAAGGKPLAWREFGAGVSEAKAKRKRILVDVYTDWCGWCKRMDRDTYSRPEVQKYLRKAFVPVRLNAESETRAAYRGGEYTYRQLAGGFGVRSFPTTLFLEPDGTHIVTAPGYMEAAEFLTVLRYIGDGHYKKKDFERYKAERQRIAAPKSPAPAPSAK